MARPPITSFQLADSARQPVSKAEAERKLEDLRAAIQAGLDSGPAQPFDVEEFLAKRPRTR